LITQLLFFSKVSYACLGHDATFHASQATNFSVSGLLLTCRAANVAVKCLSSRPAFYADARVLSPAPAPDNAEYFSDNTESPDFIAYLHDALLHRSFVSSWRHRHQPRSGQHVVGDVYQPRSHRSNIAPPSC